MKRILIIALLGLTSFGLFAQGQCGTDFMFQQLAQENPQMLKDRQQLEEIILQYTGSEGVQREGDKIIIPTVVHVFWYNCEGNISRAQVENGIEVLNRGFNLMNEDTSQVRDVFKEHMGELDIEFRLARIDPDGNATDGINRRYTTSTLNANNGIKSVESWDYNSYFNIWVVENININTGGQVNGYAQFPNNSSWNTWGVVIRHDKFGDIGTSTTDGSTMVHEAGHCFNLYHTFQDGCGSTCSSSGDRVCDTPPAANPDWSCSQVTNTCSNDAGSGSPYSFGTPDMMENFMSYSSCRWVFTKGQVNRMETWALNYYNVIEGLYAEDNLEATGVGGFQEANFEPSNQIVVADRPMVLNDETRYLADAWSWDFGASTFPPSSTDENPEVTFIHSGLMPVSLMAYYEDDSLFVEKDVFVVSERGLPAPFVDSFEELSEVHTAEWVHNDVDLDMNSWMVTSDAAYEGEQSLMIANHGVCGETSDELISSTIDLEVFSSASLSMKVAFAQREPGNSDYLRVWLSRDYGENWDLTWVRAGSSLRSISDYHQSPWMPADSTEWKEFSVNISTSYLRKGTLLKLEFGGDGGNNIYLDNLQIDGVFKEKVFLNAPENGTLGLAKDVELDWKSVGDVDFYEYQVDTESDFNSAELITGTKDYIDVSPENEDTRFLAEDLALDTKFYWRVRYSKNGEYSEWSDTWNFRISSSGLSVGQIESRSPVKVFPNPASANVIVEAHESIVRCQILDISGQLIQSDVRPLSSKRKSIDLEGVAPGVYLVEVILSDGSSSISRLVVH